MKSTLWRSLVRHPPTPKRSVVYCLFAVLTTIIALVQAVAQEPELFVVLIYAGSGVFFWFAASLVRRKEQRNEAPELDEFLRDPLVSDKYTVPYYVVVSTILTINAALVFLVDWSSSVVAAFPAALFWYLAYVSFRKKKSTIELLN